MVIFHHGDAMEDKGEEVRGGSIHQGISHRRRSFATKNVPWIRSLERMLQLRKRKRQRNREGEREIEERKEGEKLNFEGCLISDAILTRKGIGQKTPSRLGQRSKGRTKGSHEPQGRFRAHGRSMRALIIVNIRIGFSFVWAICFGHSSSIGFQPCISRHFEQSLQQGLFCIFMYFVMRVSLATHTSLIAKLTSLR